MKKTTAQYKKILWKLFSMYVRQRDKGICATCGKKDRWRNTDAGHYIPKSVGGLALYFHEKNVHCQCTGCNRFRHGNLTEYALFLRRTYGDGILEELAREKQKITKWSAQDFEEKIAHYKSLPEKINNLKE